MIVSNIEVITILVVIFFGFPIILNARKNELWDSFNFIELINTINKSLIIQGIIGLILILITLLWNSANFKFNSFIAETTYTYLIIGIFMYLPALGILNLIKLGIKKALKRKIITLKLKRKNNLYLLNQMEEMELEEKNKTTYNTI